MARRRSPSPPAPVKRMKTAKAVVSDDPAPCISPDVFDHSNIARLHTAYNSSSPFKYALVDRLFQDELLKSVKEECLGELSFTEKETDIYKVNQTGDLASLNYLTEAQISLLPNLLALRNALYSPAFRAFLRSVTGSGPLSGTKQDMSVNSYTKGCHLLNHDDVIGTRRISYILYMPLPHYQLWQKEWGGALELYPVRAGEDGVNEPECIPVKTIPPSWNQFIFFQVQPGQSFHSVEEVVVGGKGEDGRERLSISGWFHAPQEGEEGYEPEATSAETKSSREQLTSTSTIFKSYPESDPEETVPLPDAPLSEEDVAFLSEYLNPVYLQPRTMSTLGTRFVEESSLDLLSFLSNDLAQALEPRLRELDSKDGLGPERGGRIPPHDSGVDLLPTNSDDGDAMMDSPPVARSAWTLKGPPHKWRYCTLMPPSPSAPTTSVTPLSAHPLPSEIIRMLQDELFPSKAFRAWLAVVSRLMPLRYNVEARRFRPGLDYTLATSEDHEARLDVILGLTPSALEEESSDEEGARAKSRRRELRGWETAEWGGWECYMAPHNEEDDPAVYRAGTSKKKVPSNGNGKPSSSNGHSKTNGNGTTKDSPKGSPSPMHTDDEEEEQEEEEDSTLLTAQPGFNRLLVVLRDERVMRFVKYVSAAAEGSRWDVCCEYEVGMMQEDDEDDDE